MSSKVSPEACKRLLDKKNKKGNPFAKKADDAPVGKENPKESKGSGNEGFKAFIASKKKD